MFCGVGVGEMVVVFVVVGGFVGFMFVDVMLL